MELVAPHFDICVYLTFDAGYTSPRSLSPHE